MLMWSETVSRSCSTGWEKIFSSSYIKSPESSSRRGTSAMVRHGPFFAEASRDSSPRISCLTGVRP